MEHTMVNTMFIEVGSLSITRIRSFRFREFFFFSRSTIKCMHVFRRTCYILEKLFNKRNFNLIVVNSDDWNQWMEKVQLDLYTSRSLGEIKVATDSLTVSSFRNLILYYIVRNWHIKFKLSLRLTSYSERNWNLLQSAPHLWTLRITSLFVSRS